MMIPEATNTTAALAAGREVRPTAAPVPSASVVLRPRIASLDIVRGVVMVVMALDHVRWFLSDARFDPTDLSQTTVALFATRWVTHFVAPSFVFLAGTGAFLHGGRGADRRALSRFLWTRGLWLIVIEMTVVRFGWTFNVDYRHYLLGGVIWMIGWCMIGLAALVWLPTRVVGAIGLAMIVGHNTLDWIIPAVGPSLRTSPLLPLWQVLYLGGPVRLAHGGPTLAVLFVLVPWVGVMAVGYAFGPVTQMSADQRHRRCLAIGLAAIVVFFVLRTLNVYGDPTPWTRQSSLAFTVLSFLNTEKYPPSLLFLLMTLGPMIALLPVAERVRGHGAAVLTTFGRVPFWFYVLHIPVIHLCAVGLALLRYGFLIPWMTANHPMMAGPPPAGYGYGLPMVYLVTLFVVTLLYPACRWMAGIKSRRRDPWLSYL